MRQLIHISPVEPYRAERCRTISILQVLDDMALSNEAIPIDPRFDWAFNPKVTMLAPRGDAIPDWWTGDRPKWTRAVLAWFTLFEADKNEAINTDVEIQNLELYSFSNRKKRWVLVDATIYPQTSIWQYPFNPVSQENVKNITPATLRNTNYAPEYPYFYHGWGNAHKIDPSDVGAIFVKTDFRLVVRDTQQRDDRSKSKYLVSVGADYYPDMSLRWSLDYAPGVGNGRMLLATAVWRTGTFLAVKSNDKIVRSDIIMKIPVFFNGKYDLYCKEIGLKKLRGN